MNLIFFNVDSVDGLYVDETVEEFIYKMKYIIH
jgi:hypothetical protein